jgi:hypothetical protein
MQNLLTKYNGGIESTTKGDFPTALEQFRSCLQATTLIALKSSKEQKELQDFIRKISEYITAMRIELERKRLVAAVSFLLNLM